MAADIEAKLHEDTTLIQSSGGVFEVTYGGKLIFSKKSLSRFPGDNEVLDIVKGLESGLDLPAAQAKAAEGINRPISFFAWLPGYLKRLTGQS